VPAHSYEFCSAYEVRLDAIIAEDGTIRQLRVLSGHPLLIPSARNAVSQWRYRPTLLGGVAVPVLTRIDVKFVLR
jgi:protein TonB